MTPPKPPKEEKTPKKRGRGGRRQGAGRPKTLLDPAEVEKLGAAVASNALVAAHFGVDPKTVDARLEDQPEFAQAFQRGMARQKIRLSATQFEVGTGYWRCPACGNPLRTPDPTPDDPGRVKPCPDHPPEFFPETKERKADGTPFRKPWRRWIGPNPIMGIWLGKQHLGQADRSFLEEQFQRDLSKIPTGRLLELLPDALKLLGKTLPAETAEALQKGSDDKGG